MGVGLRGVAHLSWLRVENLSKIKGRNPVLGWREDDLRFFGGCWSGNMMEGCK